eukprot:TRINITY_DN357_c0_g1_i4.p1 TRINITY_DN357_c0_g1~~TRINITY_DN357_c0_g1_i4.p1  ORF type:complete len:105 (+),score=22.06 TRINITY_DN357_c0_g1_i4:142-456(+)
MIRRPPRSTQSRSSAASDVYKRQVQVQLAAQPLRVGKAPTIRNRTVPTSPSVCTEAHSQVITETHLRRRRRQPPVASNRPSQHNQAAAADESGFYSSASESNRD